MVSTATIRNGPEAHKGTKGWTGNGNKTDGDEQSNRQTEFLGCARFDPHRRSSDLAVRREYAMRGTPCAGWHTVHSRLRHRSANVREPLGELGIPSSRREPHIFVTHYHWDHIQGLPFFAPLYVENNHFQFYSFRSKFLGRDSLRQVLETQMALPYFPVDFSAMNARRKFREVDGGESFKIGENKVVTRWLNHPQGCLGFRIETPAGIVVYATDNEPGEPLLDKNLRELAADADIFINDAQFTPAQLAGNRKGWGHSSWREGVNIAREVNAKTLVLFHHDPDSTDRVIDEILQQGREEFDSVFAASEGMVITLGAANEPVQAHMPGSRTALRREAQFRASVSGVTAEGQKFEEQTLVRDLSLQGALISLKHSPRMQSELQVTMETPTADGLQAMQLRGYVVRIEEGVEKGTTAVGVVFTD